MTNKISSMRKPAGGGSGRCPVVGTMARRAVHPRYHLTCTSKHSTYSNYQVFLGVSDVCPLLDIVSRLSGVGLFVQRVLLLCVCGGGGAVIAIRTSLTEERKENLSKHNFCIFFVANLLRKRGLGASEIFTDQDHQTIFEGHICFRIIL